MLKNEFLSIFFLVFCSVLCFSKVVESTGSDNEASILLSIKESFNDPLNHLKDWKISDNINKSTSDHCKWIGVQCNSDLHVEKLDLSHMNLTGTLSDQLQGLKSLTSLNLSGNGFSLTLPRSLSNLTALESIDLSQNFFVNHFPVGFGLLPGLTVLNASGNSFSGYLPEDLGNTTFLQVLDLRGNFFEGNIPKNLKNLKSLRFLGLSGNNLTGQIPPELGQLSSLETMVMGYNGLEGEIPSEFGNLTNLKYLDLAICNLGGLVPPELGKLKKIDTIFLYQNGFKGKIPPEIGNMTSLQFLDFSYNMLSGEIPAQIGNLENLRLLNLMCNNLSGSVPGSIAKLTQLEVLELWNNTLSGSLPSDLGHDSPLQWLDVSSNSFSGLIPATLCDKGNLTKLILFNNGFNGSVPNSLTSCTSLVRIRMQNNNLSGTIPIGFGKLEKLQRLEFANNILTGQIPSDISASTSLSFIDLSRNCLESSLSSSIISIPTLQSFIASGNNLFGEIPNLFQDCPSLSVLDLSSNHLSGNIPASVASCEKLVTLNLRNNELNGTIPRSIAMMPTLSILDLSNNSLSGIIPEEFGYSAALEILNVSYNKLAGPVPTNGMLRTINPNDLLGNSALCGDVLPPCSYNAKSSSKQHDLHRRRVIGGLIIGISALLVIVTVSFGVRFLYKRGVNVNYSRNGEWPWRLMAFQKLGFDANDILSCIKESNVIGMGATGTVYKAEIQRLNMTVAVKKLWSSTIDLETGDSHDLVGEVNLLGRLRHRNIVRLLGFLHNDSDAMIVYEFMKNGSLGEALRGKILLVDWVSRYNIALGVAQGLAYLHHDCKPPVIHRDVKSNNILLDANLEARIADFGLAKMMLKRDETVSVVAGSYGYIAPEYGYTSRVDEKSDIYSYGVVLMELITGKKPLDPQFGESVDIVEWMRKRIRRNEALEEALDPIVGISKHVREEMLLILRIAVLCTAKLPRDRPSMRDVITMLEEAKPRRKSSNERDKDKPVFCSSRGNGLA